MGWFEFATTIMICSLFLNAGLYAFGFVGLSEANLSWVVNGSSISNLDENVPINVQDFNGTIDTNTSSRVTAPSVIDLLEQIPFFGTLIVEVVRVIVFFATFPMWIVYAMQLASIPKVIILFIGYPLIPIQYFATFYFIRQIVSAFKGGG